MAENQKNPRNLDENQERDNQNRNQASGTTGKQGTENRDQQQGQDWDKERKDQRSGVSGSTSTSERKSPTSQSSLDDEGMDDTELGNDVDQATQRSTGQQQANPGKGQTGRDTERRSE